MNVNHKQSMKTKNTIRQSAADRAAMRREVIAYLKDIGMKPTAKNIATVARDEFNVTL